jgi:hypothetical protein
VRCRGLRGLRGCLRQDDELMPQDEQTVKERRERLVKRGMRKYVRVRTSGMNIRTRRRPHPHNITTYPNTPTTNNIYHPSQFRNVNTPPSAAPIPPPLLEIPDFELWAMELWHDFLIEPTPYLVASAICYLGGLLVLVQYYQLIWRVLCFVAQFIPMDDEF